jgi:pyridoxal phosphate enzyme (YggS family)
LSQKELFAQKLATVKSELQNSSLLIVSKTRSTQEIKTYYELGHRDFGENRVQELLEKAEELKVNCPEIRWHMIGHLQSNKINTLFKVPNLFAIHSVHDRYLVDKLIQAEDKLDHPIEIFLQFNTSKEEEKSGFEIYTELLTSAELLVKCKKLKLTGLMTMGTLRTENFEAEAGRCFQDLQVEKEKLQSELNLKLKTSMGMSQDYKIAVREKSDMVRLGTMMFSLSSN